jgi:hypothetical protein
VGRSLSFKKEGRPKKKVVPFFFGKQGLEKIRRYMCQWWFIE